MGIEIWANDFTYGQKGGHALHGSSQAALVIVMIGPFLEKNNGNDDTYQSFDSMSGNIGRSTFKRANDALPWILGVFLEQTKVYGKEHTHSWGEPIDQKMFDSARDFIRACALGNMDAEYS